MQRNQGIPNNTTATDCKSSISFYQIFNIHSIVTYYHKKSRKYRLCNKNNIHIS